MARKQETVHDIKDRISALKEELKAKKSWRRTR